MTKREKRMAYHLAHYLVLLLLLLFAVAILIISTTAGDIFPNAILTWSLRAISLIMIFVVLALSRRGKLRNL